MKTSKSKKNDKNYSMKKKDNKGLKFTLGEGADRYYVYMLLDSKGKVFYIGKGCAGRIFDHEKTALYKLIEDESGKTLLPKEQKLISTIKNYTPVIVKWGLTKKEAFCAESALINLVKYIEPKNNALKNIINGHASKREKEFPSLISGMATQAYSVGDFLKFVAIEGVDLKTQHKVCILKNNKSLYPMYKNDVGKNYREDYIYQATRGFWRMDKARLEKIEYVISVYNEVVVGVYKVNRSYWKQRRDFSDKEMKERNKYVEDKKLIEIKDRWGFTVPKKENIDPALKSLIGKRLCNIVKTQNSVLYNFKIKQ